MYFKKLELYGFKSFVDKTTLFFEPGVTAIVGPNGTGKSNISDAIKWVLGEQSAKSIRGSKMEDAIFNGTELRPAVNMAEVSLTLSNEQRLLPIDYDEVVITRRLYRSGESEYLLNKTLVRLKDINELLMGTGIGTESYSLLEQGRIDVILSSKPEERRALFEEASGITRYKKKKNEAMRKLQATEENLLRVNDIIVEVNRQLNSIQRQVNKARRYQEQFEQLKNLDLQYTYREYNILKTQREGLAQEENEYRTKETALENEVADFSRAYEDLKSRLSEVEQNFSQLNNKVLNVSTQIENNRGRVNLNTERIEELNQRVTNLCIDIANGNKKTAELQEQLSQLESRISAFKGDKKVKEHNLNLKQTTISEIVRLIRQTQDVVETSKSQAVNLLAEQAQVKNELGKLSANIHNAQVRLLRLHQEREKTTEELIEINKTLIAKMEELKQLKDKVKQEESRTSVLQTNYNQLSFQVKNLEKEIQANKQALIARQSKLNVLEKLNRTYGGFSSGVKTFLMKKKGHPEVFSGVHDVLVNLIEVVPGYELCVETALADYLQAVVVDNMQVALRLKDFMDTQKIGRVRFIALDSIPVAGNILSPIENAKLITEVINSKQKYKNLMSYLLHNTFIVKENKSDLLNEQAARQAEQTILSEQDLKKQQYATLFSYTNPAKDRVDIVGDFNNWVISNESKMERITGDIWSKTFNLPPGIYRYRFVVDGQWVIDSNNPNQEVDISGNINSLLEVSAEKKQKLKTLFSSKATSFSGRLVNPEGELYTQGEFVSKPIDEQELGLISQKVQIRQLKVECKNLERAIFQNINEEQDKRNQLIQTEKELSALTEILNEEKIILANRDSERANIETSKKKLDDELSVIDLEVDETSLDEKELVEKEVEKKNRLEVIEKQINENEEKMAQGQELIAMKTQEREELLVVIAEMKTGFSLLNEQEAALNNNFSIMRENLNEQYANLQDCQRQKDESQKRLKELSDQVEQLQDQNQILQEEKQEAENALEKISIKRNSLMTEFEDTQNRIKNKEAELNDLKNNLRDLHVKKVELNYKNETLITTISQSYKVDLTLLNMQIPEGIDWDKQKEQIDILKSKIERMGAVNLAAVEEEEELNARTHFLSSQKEDLLTAKQSLMQAIGKINRTTKSMFLETFEKSRVMFKEYFKLLFNGGDAQLYLTEEKDVLESGIEIVVRPPGKHLQSITLLSGGEKTLTAIALLFAIFKIKPTPFCVLDEMDAPLDESNVDRFIRVLQEFLKDSQFIIITHNKKTIGMADVMYGVTMEEPGISKLVSVRFSEYKETIEQKESSSVAAVH